MLSFYEAKLKNTILFFAKEHYKCTGKYTTQIQIFKYLAFLEFESIKESGLPAFGLKYKATKFSPVPEDLYKKWSSVKQISDEDLYRVVKDNITLIVPSDKKPDIKYFFSLGSAADEEIN